MKVNINQYIEYRINRAKETFQDAEYLAENKRWNSCINRLYYACFYACIAALLKKGVESKTHNGVKSQFSKTFIKTKIFPFELGKHYSILFDFRQKGDYGDLFDFTETKVKPLIEPTKKFISIIIEYLDTAEGKGLRAEG